MRSPSLLAGFTMAAMLGLSLATISLLAVAGEPSAANLGDISTLADPAVVDDLIETGRTSPVHNDFSFYEGRSAWPSRCRRIASRISCLASSTSPQPMSFTHLPDSRSL